jgi:acyl carrier protein
MVAIMIFERLCAILAEQFSINENSITMDTTFVDDLGVDSLDVVELTMAIEEAFDVPEFDDALIAELVTVGDLFRFISISCD